MGTDNLQEKLDAFCEDVESYVEGTLAPTRRREMDDFLKVSAEARQILEEFRQADALFDDCAWDVPEPKSLPTAQHILDTARLRTPMWRRWLKILGSAVPNPLRSPVFAGIPIAALLLGVTWYVVRPGHEKPELQVSQAPRETAAPAVAPSPPSGGFVEKLDTRTGDQSGAVSKTVSEPEAAGLKSGERSEIEPSAGTGSEVAPNRKIGETTPAAPKTTPSDGPQPSPTLPSMGAPQTELSKDPGAKSVPEMRASPPPPPSGAVGGQRRNSAGDLIDGNDNNAPRKPAEESPRDADESLRYRPASKAASENSDKPVSRPAAVETVTLEIQAVDLETARQQFMSATEQSGGVIVQAKQPMPGNKEIVLTSSVPENRLDGYLTQLERLGKVENRRSDDDDSAKEKRDQARSKAEVAASQVPAPATAGKSADTREQDKKEQEKKKKAGKQVKVVVRLHRDK